MRFTVLRCFFACCFLGLCSQAQAQQPNDSLARKVSETGVLRCGYAVWPGLVEKDPNTGQLSGLFVQFMEELGRVAELKIEWVGEFGWADFIEALNTNKIDAMCAGIWTNAVRGKRVLFTEPIAFETVLPVVREEDTRFDADATKLNDRAVKIVTVDGESAQTVASSDFPKASQFALPQRSDAALMIANVLHRKGDATFLDSYTARDFQSKNPGQLKVLATPFPLRVFGLAIGLRQGESTLKATLDNATRQLLWMGVVEKLIKENPVLSKALLRVASPFSTVLSQ